MFLHINRPLHKPWNADCHLLGKSFASSYYPTKLLSSGVGTDKRKQFYSNNNYLGAFTTTTEVEHMHLRL